MSEEKDYKYEHSFKIQIETENQENWNTYASEFNFSLDSDTGPFLEDLINIIAKWLKSEEV